MIVPVQLDVTIHTLKQWSPLQEQSLDMNACPFGGSLMVHFEMVDKRLGLDQYFDLEYLPVTTLPTGESPGWERVWVGDSRGARKQAPQCKDDIEYGSLSYSARPEEEGQFPERQVEVDEAPVIVDE